MNNAELFYLQLKAKIVQPAESDAIEQRRISRLLELASEG